ncbi:MAG: glycosyltransferase family 4 protein [Betaproteobacteria bacterium]|nr:glycosyltransferase family 4 protein [Betaproteobacteria bacterium]
MRLSPWSSFSVYYLLPFISMLVSFVVLRLLLSPRAPLRFLDHPNERSLHSGPVPRTGGIAVVLGILAGTIWIAGYGLPLAGALALAGISLIDDWRGLPQVIRLASHLAVAAAFVVFLAPGMSLLAQSLLIVAVGWMTNLYNFMDGSDGLAGGMAIMGFGFYTFAAWLAGDSAMAWFCACVVGASVPFLLFNFSPSKIFLGDAGAIPLGFLAAALGVLGWQRGNWSLWFPLLVFSPFIADATVTLGRRLVRKERVWQAHRDHYYQRLIRLGWSHRKTALAAYIVMLAAGSLGLLALVDAAGAVPPIIVAAMYLFLGLLIDRAWSGRASLDRA